MRLGVLDVGSNTVHLLIVDAHRGAHPWPAYSEKSVLRLGERIGPDGALATDAENDLVAAVAAAHRAAGQHRVDELLGFATSAVRDAANCEAVLDRVRAETGVKLSVLAGEDEARVTFLAVRRWFGWSSGQLLVLDIGGGSLEIAAGIDEAPEFAVSLPLGAGRLTRERLSGDPPAAASVDKLRAHVRRQLTKVKVDGWDRAAATSKTFRTLAQLAGAAPAQDGFRVPRSLTLTGLRQILGFIRHMPAAAVAELDGVSTPRANQLLAGAVVAEAVMEHLGVDRVDICPWALREGVILNRLDAMGERPSATTLGR